MHGPKAMKAISDHVATRTPVQVFFFVFLGVSFGEWQHFLEAGAVVIFFGPLEECVCGGAVALGFCGVNKHRKTE